MTREVPYKNLRDEQVIRVVSIDHIKPPRPAESPRSIPDGVWNLITRCWNDDPNERPLSENLEAMVLKFPISIHFADIFVLARGVTTSVILELFRLRNLYIASILRVSI
jgi:hypothetical protein